MGIDEYFWIEIWRDSLYFCVKPIFRILIWEQPLKYPVSLFVLRIYDRKIYSWLWNVKMMAVEKRMGHELHTNWRVKLMVKLMGHLVDCFFLWVSALSRFHEGLSWYLEDPFYLILFTSTNRKSIKSARCFRTEATLNPKAIKRSMVRRLILIAWSIISFEDCIEYRMFVKVKSSSRFTIEWYRIGNELEAHFNEPFSIILKLYNRTVDFILDIDVLDYVMRSVNPFRFVELDTNVWKTFSIA